MIHISMGFALILPLLFSGSDFISFTGNKVSGG